MLRKADFIEVMAKHLPPSASSLRLLDVGGQVSADLLERRPDLLVEVGSLYTPHWTTPADSIDSVAGYDLLIRPEFLAVALEALRPGGRMIVVNPEGVVDEALVQALEMAGFIRILVEPAVENQGVLIRGEKPHRTSDTLARVQSVAEGDSELLDLDNFKGRFVHLLIQQLPNKPVWRLQPDEMITWNAVAVQIEGVPHLLAFSSLPRAVGFMQPAVLDGFIQNVNKVGKFSKQTASTWELPILLNPTLESVQAYDPVLVTIDPDTAEAPDE